MKEKHEQQKQTRQHDADEHEPDIQSSDAPRLRREDHPNHKHPFKHRRHHHHPKGHHHMKPGKDHHGPHDQFRRHGKGRGKHFGRIFDSDELQYVILHLVADEPRHGYEVIKLIEELLAGAHAPSPGMVYPTLTLLQEMGLTESQTQGTRKIYAITEQGQKELADNQPRIQAILQRMQEIGQKHANERPPQLVRAFENLKMAVQIHSGKWTPDLLASATEILDQAARQIERL